MLSADPPTMVLGLPGAPGLATAAMTGLETLLFGLSLAVALPPAVLLSRPGVALPTVHPTSRPSLRVAELEAVVGRPALEMGHGRIALREVDPRLDGLDVVLDTYRMTDAGTALVCVGMAGPDGAVGRAGGATAASLWTLARETLPRYAVVCEHRIGSGDSDALLVRYAGTTAQIIWLPGACLATVSVTSLDGDEARIVELAHTIAVRLDGRLRQP